MTGARLSARQAAFVREYMRCGDPVKAAIAAGYATKSAKDTGPRLMKKDEISRRIKVCQQKRNERLELAEDFELVKAIELFEMCTGKRDVPVSGKAGADFAPAFAPAAAAVALQLIAKLRGKLTQKVEIDLADHFAEDIEAAEHVS